MPSMSKSRLHSAFVHEIGADSLQMKREETVEREINKSERRKVDCMMSRGNLSLIYPSSGKAREGVGVESQAKR